MNRIQTFIHNYIADFFIILGLIVLITTTFLIDFIAGSYTFGAMMLLLGVYFNFPNRGRWE